MTDKPVTEKTLVTLPDGRQGYQYPSGAIRKANGQYLVAPPWTAPPFDKNTVVRRHEMARQAVADGIMTATKTETEREAVKKTAEVTTEIMLEKNGIASIQAAKFLYHVAGWSRPREAGPAVAVNVVALPDSLVAILTQRAGITAPDSESWDDDDRL